MSAPAIQWLILLSIVNIIIIELMLAILMIIMTILMPRTTSDAFDGHRRSRNRDIAE